MINLIKLHRTLILTLAAAGTLALSSAPAWSANCLDDQLDELIAVAARVDPAVARRQILDLAKAQNVPAFLKTTPTGDIPVLLMNAQTAPKLASFLAESMGTQIQLQPDWKNDHGMLRVTGNIIDVDSPGARGFGELHETGLAWKNLASYMPRRNANHSRILEIAYKLTPLEREYAEYYQRVRRAAIFRVKFTFGGGQQDTNFENMLSGGGEHCFLFCRGNQVSTQIQEIEGKLRTGGIADVAALYQSSDIQRFLDSVATKVMAADTNSPASLNARLVQNPDDLNIIARYKPAGMSTILFAEWLVALDASKKYQQLIRQLGISGNAMNMNDAANPRASAILIYDSGSVENSFRNATYTTNGIFYSWTANGQKPLQP